MAYLIKTVETYRVENEKEAKELIENSKKNPVFTLSKYTSEKKEAKKGGEVVNEWVRVVLTKTFTSEKEPDMSVFSSYNTFVLDKTRKDVSPISKSNTLPPALYATGLEKACCV